jgi:CubicO group peptidase (beta-lactamase class C family)
MVLNGGVADGRRIVSTEWISASTQPTGPENDQRGGYGLQWWTFANTDSFAAIGLQGQYIYIDPATQTVVVKLSYFPPGGNNGLEGETLAFMDAVSAWKPR